MRRQRGEGAPMKVGVIANEFFDPSLGRMGGFGWVAWATARALQRVGGHEPVFLTTEFDLPAGEVISNGTRLLAPTGGLSGKFDFVRRLQHEAFDALITVDWRPHYRKMVLAMPRIPLLVWVQDPRTS